MDESIGLSPAVQENLARYVGSENDLLQFAATISSITPVTSLEKDTVILDKLVTSPVLGTTTPAQIQLSSINTAQKACVAATVPSEAVQPTSVGTSTPITMVTRTVQPSISGGTTLLSSGPPSVSRSNLACLISSPRNTMQMAPKTILPTDLDPNIPYVPICPGTMTIETQTGISSVEAFP